MTEKTGSDCKEGLYTFGPIIHNPQVVTKLESKNIKSVDSLEKAQNGHLVIRSHGVAPDVIDRADKLGIKVYDATCPFVKKAQKLAQQYGEKGYQIIIVGDGQHPEVQGIVGWAGKDSIVVENKEQARELPNFDKVAVVAQTTQTADNFKQIVHVIDEKANEVQICNTICDSTQQRQNAAIKLAKLVDVVLVVGGKNSANTKKLALICQQAGTTAYHIETSQEIKEEWFKGVSKVGITAGASTPGWILEEVMAKMNDVNDGLKEFQRGDIISGKVIQVSDNEVMVDVGGKSEGIIPLSELSLKNIESPAEETSVGDEIDVYVIKAENEEGNPILSKKRADRQMAWDSVEEAFNDQKVIEAEVISVVKGGILVDLGVRGFLPASLIDRGYVENLEQYVGQKLQVKVIELDKEKNKIILSRKVVLDEENEKLKAETWDTLEEGQTKKGIVRRLTDFGAFVDLGGVDGLLHVSELSWGRVGHPQDVLSVGDEVEVFILGIDKDKGKVSLGMKQLQENPWSKVEEKYTEGSIVSGKVVRMAPFGVFVELEPGVEGLVHISQISHEHIGTPDEAVSTDQEVNVKVLSVDKKEQRISLSIKETTESKKSEEVNNYIEEQQKEEGSGVTIGDIFGDLLEEAKKDGKK